METTKADFVEQISQKLDTGKVFVHTTKNRNPSQLLFAVDLFRRRNHDVLINVEANENSTSSLHIVIHPEKNCLDMTIRRNETESDIISRIKKQTMMIRIRGCGRVIDTVYGIIRNLINAGWYLEKTTLNSLTQKNGLLVHINTTLQAVLRRG
tara:strand:- start:433 stop:891 length:459 start_codon:yes stop_codon:yes gene_type:complete